MITFAAYAGRDIDLTEVAVASVLADTAISFIAGFAVFPIVFAHGLDPAAGPGLVFVTLPLAFADMPFGTAAAIAFFLLIFVAALASAISMLELPVALLLRHGWSRPRASLAVGAACFATGLGTVFSFNLWAGWYPLAALPGFASATVFELLDYLTSNILLPLGGLGVALFAGWAVPVRALVAELGLSPPAATLLSAMLRYVVPLGIAAVGLGPLLD